MTLTQWIGLGGWAGTCGFVGWLTSARGAEAVIRALHRRSLRRRKELI